MAETRTRGEQMLALRRARMAASPPFLRGGYRPFFLCGAFWALAALAFWLLALAGAIRLPTLFDPLAWHRHEMLFGFVGAVVAGYVLSAIPNWTGKLPIAGPPLAFLVALWAAGRIAILFSTITGAVAASLVDAGFYLLLAALAAREVRSGKNRNRPMVLIVLLLGGANALDHAAAAGLLADPMVAIRAAIGLIVMMISLVGGRIIPSFTRNWMAKRKIRDRLPTQPGRYDRLVLTVTAAALAGWVAAPELAPTGVLLVVAGAMQAVRLSRWGGFRSRRDPLVLILHVGYFWVPVGLALVGAAILGAPVPTAAAVHALTAGAMATLILAVMTRTTLSHTGRDPIASPADTIVFLLVTIGATLRVAAPLGWVDYRIGMELSALAWGGAFLGFLIVSGPRLVSPRLDDPDM